eukprot:XP_019073958.1 PREDICTED: polygalacturonase [Vitis vinifera]
MVQYVSSSSLLLAAVLFMVLQPYWATAVTYNVVNLGAKGDGHTDSTKAFLNAWAAACGSASPATIYVPPGRYLLLNAVFRGCKNHAITFRIDATLVAPSDYRVIGNAANWLAFQDVTGVSIIGGVLDGQGTGLWAFGPGATNLWIENVACGPGHGISIGSLGKDLKEEGVQNVTVKTVTFTGSQNGVRIKSWARASNGFVKRVVFQHILMVNVQNPIVIDQNYCPGHKNCPGQVSGVKVSDVTYQDIHGTSASEVAMKFDCSSKNPCSGIKLEDVKLTYRNKAPESSCVNAGGMASGFVEPASCL